MREQSGPEKRAAAAVGMEMPSAGLNCEYVSTLGQALGHELEMR